MSMVQSTLIQRIRGMVGSTPFQDSIAAASGYAVVDSLTATVKVADTTLYGVGSIIEFQDGTTFATNNYEQVVIKTIVNATDLTVWRGMNGTTAQSAHANNTVILKDPLWPVQSITDSIEQNLRDLWPYVYKSVSETLTPNATGDPWYNMASSFATIIDLSTVYQVKGSGSSANIVAYGTQTYPVMGPLFNLPTTKVATGVGLFIPHLADTSNSIIVTGLAKIGTGTTGTTSTFAYSDISDGIQSDCVSYYTVADLLTGADVDRTTAQDISMGDQTVQPLARTKLSQMYERMGQNARSQWMYELSRTLPRMKRYPPNRRASS